MIVMRIFLLEKQFLAATVFDAAAVLSAAVPAATRDAAGDGYDLLGERIAGGVNEGVQIRTKLHPESFQL